MTPTQHATYARLASDALLLGGLLERTLLSDAAAVGDGLVTHDVECARRALRRVGARAEAMLRAGTVGEGAEEGTVGEWR